MCVVLWTAQGKVLFDNSDTDTIGRNSGVFWFMLQCRCVREVCEGCVREVCEGGVREVCEGGVRKV